MERAVLARLALAQVLFRLVLAEPDIVVAELLVVSLIMMICASVMNIFANEIDRLQRRSGARWRFRSRL